MNNGNAVHFMSALGMDPECYEIDKLPINEFAAMLSRFEGSEIESVIDGELPRRRVGNWFEGGRPAGYLVDRVAQAKQQTEEAISKGAETVSFL